MDFAYLLAFGLLVASPVFAYVYRDSAEYDGERRVRWAAVTALLTGTGAALSFAYASRIVFAAARVVRGAPAITNPWTVPLTYAVLTAGVVVLTVVGYRFAVRSTSTGTRNAV